MKPSLSGFRQFIEDETHSLEKGHQSGVGHKGSNEDKPENYLDGMWRELGIHPDDIPDIIESGPIEFDGIYYNQALWKVIKPIDLKDEYVRIQFHKSLSPNINQRAYRRKDNGKMEPYEGQPDTNTHLITIEQLAKMLGRDWTTVTGQQGQGGPPPMV
jgi:hypothetical protein